MNYEALKRRALMDGEKDEGLKRRKRRVAVPEDYDEDDFGDDYHDDGQVAGHRSVSDDKSSS